MGIIKEFVVKINIAISFCDILIFVWYQCGRLKLCFLYAQLLFNKKNYKLDIVMSKNTQINKILL